MTGDLFRNVWVVSSNLIIGSNKSVLRPLWAFFVFGGAMTLPGVDETFTQLKQGGVETFRHPEFARHAAGRTNLSTGRPVLAQPGNGLTGAGYDHFLTTFHLFKQTGQLGFGFMDIDDVHGTFLS